MTHPFRIVSIDGGGLKGLIAIKILQIIETITSQKLTDQFDFFAGTSTGGLIVSALNAPQPDKRALDLDDIEELYLQVVEQIMQEGRFALSGNESEEIKKIFRKVFGRKKLSSVFKPVFIPAFDAMTGETVFFTTREAKAEAAYDPYLVDVCQATSAVPDIFPPHMMAYGGRKIKCVDAGIYHLKNPALEALKEVWEKREVYAPGLEAGSVVLLSISTGSYGNNKNHWSTDIYQTYSKRLLESTVPGLDAKAIKYMRVDINMKQGGLSISQVVDWTNAISELSTNALFRKDVENLLL